MENETRYTLDAIGIYRDAFGKDLIGYRGRITYLDGNNRRVYARTIGLYETAELAKATVAAVFGLSTRDGRGYGLPARYAE